MPTPARGTADRILDTAERLVQLRGYNAFSYADVAKAVGIAEARRLTKPVSLQAYYTIAGRDLEREIVPMLQSEGVGLMVWSPLAGGLLSGKYSRADEQGDGGRRANFDFPPIDKEQADRIVEALRPIAKAHGVSVARVALAWVRQKPFVTSTIIGAKDLTQLNDNLEAVSLTLSPQEIATLDEVSAERPQYPHWMAKRNNATRVPTGEPVKMGGPPPKN